MDISNKTLAAFLVAAIAVSVFGMVFSINKLNNIQYVKPATGYATSASGTASVYINTTTAIKFAVSEVNFGTGSVNGTEGSEQNCTLNTESLVSAGCMNFAPISTPFVIENEGTTVAVIRLRSNATAAQFIGGDSQAGGPQFKYKVSNSEANSCSNPLPGAYTDVNTSTPGSLVCNDLAFNSANNTLAVDVQINIPYTAVQGQKSALLEAQASSS